MTKEEKDKLEAAVRAARRIPMTIEEEYRNADVPMPKTNIKFVDWLIADLDNSDKAELESRIQLAVLTIKHLKTKDLIFVPGTLPTSLELFLIKNKFRIDFVFIDAVGDFKNVFGELSLIWPYLSNDGYIICHFHKERLQYAVDSFAKKNQANYIPIFRQYANSPISGSIAVLSKPITKFRFLKRLNYIYRFNEKKGYYFFKRIFMNSKIRTKYLLKVFRHSN